MEILLKNGKAEEIPEDWIDEWNKVYYDVPRALSSARIWCLDNEAKRKTKRGLRSFLGRWIRKDCVRRPVPFSGPIISDEKVVGDTKESLVVRQTHLARLKELVK